VAIALDPHYKLKLVQFAYERIYGMDEGFLKAILVYDTLVALFNEYKTHCSPSSNPQPPPSQAQQEAPPKQLMKAATYCYANVSNVFLFFVLINYFLTLALFLSCLI